MDSHRRRADWSDLFPELLSTIAGNLPTPNDVIHLRSVCTKWRSSVPEIPQNLPVLSHIFPHKLSTVPPPLLDSNDFYLCVSRGLSLVLVPNSTYLIKPKNNDPKESKPWLVTVEEVNPGKFYVRRPLTRFIIEGFAEKFFKELDLSGFDVLEVCKGYNFRLDSREKDDVYFCCHGNWSINKVIVLVNPNCGCPSVDDCVALVLYDTGILAFVRLRNESCGCITYSRVSRFDDIVNYNGKVCAIDRKGRVYVICYDSMRMSVLVNVPLWADYVGGTRKRLVESSGELYLIERVYGHLEEIEFKVHKLNKGARKWEEAKSLDGRVLFVCTDYCFFVEARDFPGCKGDCIFFPKGHFPAYHGSIYPDDFFFRKVSEELQVGVFHLETCSGLISTFQGYSNFLWPPPRWLCQDSCGEDENMEMKLLNQQAFNAQNLENPLAIYAQERATGSGEIIMDADLMPAIAPRLESSEEATSRVELQEIKKPWSDLNQEILAVIARHLKSRIYVCRLRAVCRKWRSCCPPLPDPRFLSPFLPHNISLSKTPYPANGSVTLVANTVYLLQPCRGSAKPWLVTVEEVVPGKLCIRSPLKKHAIKEFPQNFPKVCDLLDFHVYEICKGYNMQSANNRGSAFACSRWAGFDDKVVLYSNLTSTSPTIDDCTFMVLYGNGALMSCRLTDGDGVLLRCGVVSKFDDIVNFKGEIYAIDRKGRAYIISCNAGTIHRIVSDAVCNGYGADMHKRLVESDGELYLVVRHSPGFDIFFKVYKLNEDHHKWDEVKSLDHKVLFITSSHCFMASTRDLPGWKGNCIVFPEDCFPTYSANTNPDWIFFRKASKELEIGVFYFGDADGARLITSYAGYSDLLWPAPAWLQRDTCLSR